MNDSDGSTFAYAVERDGVNGTVAATGEIDLASSPDFRQAIQDLLDAGVQHLVVDLGGVTFIDSSGLGVLVGALKRVNETADGALVIRELAGPARKVFEITGLDAVFTIVD